MTRIDVCVWQGNKEIFSDTSGTPLEVGRQQKEENDDCVLQIQDFGNAFRLVIARLSSVAIPRKALSIGVDDEGGLTLLNLHPRMVFLVGPQSEQLPPGALITSPDELVVSLPDMLTIRAVLVNSIGSVASNGPDVSFRELDEPVASMMTAGEPTMFGQLFEDDHDTDRGRAAVDLVRQTLTVVQKSAGSNEFFDSAVEAAATMIQLDRTFVLLRSGQSWQVRSMFDATSDTAAKESEARELEVPSGSRVLLKRIVETGKTVIYEPNSYLHTKGSSILMLDRAVAAPILDPAGEVIGVLYGDRRFGSQQRDTSIGDLEAALLEVMAGALSAGLARQRQEQIRASMTQFFSPSVTDRLEHDDDLLSGRDAEVSVLFCDIRGFSGIAERVGPKGTIEWINDVLTQLSECVMRTDGVLVDYVGDELMAMWGAPAAQADHARRACKAAQEMLAQREPLRRKWSSITPDQFGFGIGINTGMARVGNTGSKVKFKYGPLGNTVNIASRVQGMTKKFGVSALITQSTASAIATEEGFFQRRLATVRPLGVREPLGVHQLYAEWDEKTRVMAGRYENALDSFHASDLTSAARELASLVHEYPDDQPSVVLLGRVVNAITSRVEAVDPILEFQSK
ncbi:MAG: adenylate/guanylate cyclase domain-containing protein [Planctomycetota bacterium]